MGRRAVDLGASDSAVLVSVVLVSAAAAAGEDFAAVFWFWLALLWWILCRLSLLRLWVFRSVLWHSIIPTQILRSYPASYPAYASQPSTVNVVYPPAQPPVYVDHANPVIHEYDQYGQQVSGPEYAGRNSGSSPIYLIATKDHTIQAVLSYSTNGSVLQYTTLDHQQRTVPISQVDRDLTLRLNRERHVSFQMPQ